MKAATAMTAVKAAALAAIFFVGIAAAAGKNVAVVETELDAQSGVADKLNKAEIREITAELRRQATKNLPKGKFNIMTSETVMSQGSAVLEECADENCVISLGAKIGADYIVRGTISKFQTMLTLTVEIYETEDGNLIASSDAVRSESALQLLEQSKQACVDMYKSFLESLDLLQKTPPPTEARASAAKYTLTVDAEPSDGGNIVLVPNKSSYYADERVSVSAMARPGYSFGGWSGAASGHGLLNRIIVVMDNDKSLTAIFTRTDAGVQTAYTAPERREPVKAERKNRTGFTSGYVHSGEAEGYEGYAGAFQLGLAHVRPLTENYFSYAVEAGMWYGFYSFDVGSYNTREGSHYGVNIPVLCQLDLAWLSLETGTHFDLLFSENSTIFNFGLVAGAGLGSRTFKIFWRMNTGTAYGSQTFGIRKLF